jgi:hypothetical protein
MIKQCIKCISFTTHPKIIICWCNFFQYSSMAERTILFLLTEQNTWVLLWTFHCYVSTIVLQKILLIICEMYCLYIQCCDIAFQSVSCSKYITLMHMREVMYVCLHVLYPKLHNRLCLYLVFGFQTKCCWKNFNFSVHWPLIYIKQNYVNAWNL